MSASTRKPLNALATDMVGDGKSPNMYFVCDAQGDCIMVTRNAKAAYREWKRLASARPLSECTLEDRKTGTVCSVEPSDDEPNSPLHTWDDSEQYMKGAHA